MQRKSMFCLARLSWFWICLGALICTARSQEAPVAGAAKSPKTVLVRVNVTDPLNRQVTGLQKDNFEVYENNAKQPITYFAQQSVPMSVSVVCDLTEAKESMRKQIGEAFRDILASANPEDEFFLVSFDQKNAVLETATATSWKSENVPGFGQVLGITPLDVAIHVGMDKLEKEAGKRALIIITTADEEEIDLAMKVWKISDQPGIQVFIIKKGVSPKSSLKPNERVYVLSGIDELGYYLNLAYSELRSQYVLGFPDTSKRQTGKERRVHLNPPDGLPKLTLRVITGFYDAP
jgi:Ca-activated chloride channel homolog